MRNNKFKSTGTCRGGHACRCNKCILRRVGSLKPEIMRDVIEFLRTHHGNVRRQEWSNHCINDPSRGPGAVVPPLIPVHPGLRLGQLSIPSHQDAKRCYWKGASTTVRNPGKPQRYILEVKLEVEYNETPAPVMTPTHPRIKNETDE
ncbi:hypothetical protein PNOK_0751600 [Pyrrhoderma noxium]|uniref:Uncharacterized protein n=1 Tax=Pyrrhoderma noxium TaxID=2282107 RepID=A0A286UCW3_9AGAM|nr:hypothetical protein PNOK_0751600 [Pyrrhoderma noxium]